MPMADERSVIQESQYEFPYHHIPHFVSRNVPMLSRRLSWGLEYLCCIEHIRRAVLELRPNSVIDIGCGDGRVIGSLSSDVPVCVGVDLSSRAIDFARAFHPNVAFYAAEAGDVEGQFDVALAVEVLEHIPDGSVATFINQVAQKVKVGGVVVLSVPSINAPLNKKHFRHYDQDLLGQQIRESGAPLLVDRFEFVYRQPWWLRYYGRVVSNRHVSLEVPAISAVVWNRVWERHRIASPSDGRHLVAFARRT